MMLNRVSTTENHICFKRKINRKKEYEKVFQDEVTQLLKNESQMEKADQGDDPVDVYNDTSIDDFGQY